MILVTGCNSLLGKRLVKRLTESGQKVRCLDFDKPKELPVNVEFVQGDLLDETTLKKACKNVKTVLHLMDIKSPRRRGRRYMKKINVRGTGNLLREAQSAGAKKFLFLSTYEIYGNTKKIPTRQDDRKRPLTKYGRDKLMAEKICWAYEEQGKINTTVFRPSLVIGPGTNNPIILITLLMALGMEKANRLYITGNGDSRFQLVHPDSVVDAFMLAYDKDISGGKIYNLGSDNVPTQIEQIVKIKERGMLDFSIKHMSTLKTKFLSVALRPFKVNYLNREHLIYLMRNLILDCQGAKKDLGWSPMYDNIEILLETIKWYKEDKL